MPKDYNMQLLYVEQRLKTWASWYTQFLTSHLGYAHIPFHQLMLGMDVISSSRSSAIPINSVAESVEKALFVLRQQDEQLAKVLMIHYAYPGRYPDHARAAGLTCSRFAERVKQGKCWLVGWFTASGEL